MKLYHFTHPAKLPSSTECGLVPFTPDVEFMTMGNAVVWLTTGKDDSGWIRPKERRATARRLTVRIEPANKRLAHFATWLRKQRGSFIGGNGRPGRYGDLIAYLPAGAEMNWYVYFGTIPPSKIDGLT